MILIDKITDVDGQETSLNTLVNDYYKKLFIDGWKLSAMDTIKHIVNNKTSSGKEYDFFNEVLNSFEKIIKSKPPELFSIIEDFDKKGYNDLLYDTKKDAQTLFGSHVEDIFEYRRFRNNKAVWLARRLNIKVCLYCNAQYTLTINQKNKKRALFQFDHFFSKSRYPYLSISFYNLIPSCSLCNGSKSMKKFNLIDYVHPYHEDFDKLSIFKTDEESVIDYVVKGKKDFKNLKLTLQPRDHVTSGSVEEKKVTNHDSAFSLTDIYEHHRDIVSELYTKAYFYNESRKKELLKMPLFEGSNEKLFTEEELGRFLVGNYTLDKDINKRPLAKLCKDIAKDIGLI